MKAVKPALSPYAHCYCDLFSDSEEEVVRGEARTMHHTLTDGPISPTFQIVLQVASITLHPTNPT